MKKVLAVSVLIFILLLSFTACGSTADYGEECVSNGTFESKGTSDWTIKQSSSDTTAPTIKSNVAGSDNYNAALGSYYISVTGKSYTYYTESVNVDKDSVYYLTAMVKINTNMTVTDDASAGAFVGLGESNIVMDSVNEATDGWVSIGVYFNSKSYSKVTVRFGVGNATYTADGTAFFDNVSLVKLKDYPQDVLVVSLSGSNSTVNADYRINDDGVLFIVLTSVLGALVLYALYVLLRRLSASQNAFIAGDGAVGGKGNFFKSSTFMLTVAMLIGFAVRVVLVNFVYGGSTMTDYMTYASKLAELGAVDFYAEYTPNVSIGTLYILWALAKLASPLGLVTGSTGMAIFLKIPAIIADLIAIFLVFYVANRKYNTQISALFAGAYAVLPIIFIGSAAWGIYASVGALFLMLAVLNILDKNYILVALFYSLALLFSAEMLLVLPLLLVYLAYIFVKNDDAKMKISVSFTVSVIALYLIALPFTLSYFVGRPFIIVTRYIQLFLQGVGFTDNSFTVYGLLGLGSATANTAAIVFSSIFVASIIIFTMVCYFKSRSRLDILLLFATTFVITFVMTVRVSVWIMYPAFALLLLYAVIANDRRVLKSCAGLSLVAGINAAYELMISGYIGNSANATTIYMAGNDPVLIIFSLFNVLITAYLLYAVYDICINDRRKGILPMRKNYFVYVKEISVSVWAAVRDFAVKTINKIKRKPKNVG